MEESKADGSPNDDEDVRPELNELDDRPMSENAYPEDFGLEVDGKFVSMNDTARNYNKRMGLVDKAAKDGRQHKDEDPEND